MHLEAITLEGRRIFDRLNKFSEFYLVGGTALALQIGHRRSADFDLFSEKDIFTANLRKKVKRVFNEFNIKTAVSLSGQLTVIIDGTKIDFVKYPFPLIMDLIDFRGIKMAKIQEIAAMKAHTLSYRGTEKDYIDLYFILKEKYTTLKKIQDIAEKKYKNEFNMKLFLEQIVYLEDLKKEKQPMEFLKKEPKPEEMKTFFRQEIKNIKI